MKDNLDKRTNEIFSQVRVLRIEFDKLRMLKSKLKMKLFYEPENQEYKLELKKLNERNDEIIYKA